MDYDDVEYMPEHTKGDMPDRKDDSRDCITCFLLKQLENVKKCDDLDIVNDLRVLINDFPMNSFQLILDTIELLPNLKSIQIGNNGYEDIRPHFFLTKDQCQQLANMLIHRPKIKELHIDTNVDETKLMDMFSHTYVENFQTSSSPRVTFIQHTIKLPCMCKRNLSNVNE